MDTCAVTSGQGAICPLTYTVRSLMDTCTVTSGQGGICPLTYTVRSSVNMYTVTSGQGGTCPVRSGHQCILFCHVQSEVNRDASTHVLVQSEVVRDVSVHLLAQSRVVIDSRACPQCATGNGKRCVCLPTCTAGMVMGVFNCLLYRLV